MNANKITACAMMAILALSCMMPLILAEEVTVITATGDGLTKEAGVSPDSALYGLDRAMESVRLAFTFNNAKKSEIALENAEERLAEIKAMIQAKKQDKAEVAGEYHKKSMEQVRKFMGKIESNGNEETAKYAYEQTEKIRIKTEAHKAKIIAVKAGVLEMQRSKISEEELTDMEHIFNRAQQRTEDTEMGAIQKQDNIRVRYRILSGKSESETAEALGVKVQTQEKASEETSEQTQSNMEESNSTGQSSQSGSK